MSTGLRLRERRRAIFILMATCIPLILLTCRTVQASPDSGPDIDVPGGRKISDQGGMDVDAQRSTTTPPEVSVHIDETLSLAGMASGAGLAAARRMMMQRQQDEEEKEKRKRGPMGSGSSAKGSSSTKSFGSSAIGFVGGRPFSQGELPKAMPTSFNAQLIDKGSSDDKEFPWHEVPGAYLGSMASILPSIIGGTKEDYGAWATYFKDPTSVAPSNIAPYLKQYGSESMGFPVKGINAEAGAVVMTAVDFFGLGKIPFTGNLPRGLILENLKHGGGWEGLQEGFRYTSLGQVGMIASIALDPSMDEHLRAQCAGQLLAQGSLVTFTMVGPKLLPKLKSMLVEGLVDAEDVVDFKNYYDDGNFDLVLRGKTVQSRNVRVLLPQNLIDDLMEGEGLVEVEVSNPMTGKTYSFYKVLNNVEKPDIDIPTKIMENFDFGQEVILKVKRLPMSKFIDQLGGEASEIIKFNEDGVPEVNLGGKEVQIEGLKDGYANYSGREGGSAYLEFQIKDAFDKDTKFRLYDDGLDEPRLTVFDGDQFRPVEGMEYDPARDAINVEYYHSERNRTTTLRFREMPDEMDLDAGMASEEMIARVKTGKKIKMGEVGEEIAAKFAEEKLKAKVFGKNKLTGPDRKIILDGDPGILEAKLTTYESQLETQFVDAIDDVCRRFKENSEYRQGVAVAVYFDKNTGNFDYIYRIVTPETQDTAFDGLRTASVQTGMDVSIQVQPPIAQNFAGYTGNNGKGLNEQTMFGYRNDARQDSEARSTERTGQQSTGNDGQAPNMQTTQGGQSKPLYIDHSQPRDQPRRSSNQSSNNQTQDRGQEQGSKTTNSDPKKESIDNSSKTSKAQNERQQTTFEGREGSGKPMTQQAQQAQQQGQQTKQQGNNSRVEPKPAPSDKSGKNDSRQGQQAQKGGGETAKGNERPAPANSNSSNKAVKDPDSRNAPSGRSGAIPI